jgi:hypothetical protein
MVRPHAENALCEPTLLGKNTRSEIDVAGITAARIVEVVCKRKRSADAGFIENRKVYRTHVRYARSTIVRSEEAG